jgi:hypothetical protein
VRRVRVAVDVVALAVRFEAVAKALHVLEMRWASSTASARPDNIKRCLDAELAFYAVQVFRIGLTF